MNALWLHLEADHDHDGTAGTVECLSRVTYHATVVPLEEQATRCPLMISAATASKGSAHPTSRAENGGWTIRTHPPWELTHITFEQRMVMKQ